MMHLSKNLRTVTNSDGGAVLDLHQGKMFRLNTTGAKILDLVARGSTEESIATEISQTCGVDIGLVSADVHAFLAALRNSGLLERDDRQ
jgi:hypothetical protein